MYVHTHTQCLCERSARINSSLVKKERQVVSWEITPPTAMYIQTSSALIYPGKDITLLSKAPVIPLTVKWSEHDIYSTTLKNLSFPQNSWCHDKGCGR